MEAGSSQAVDDHHTMKGWLNANPNWSNGHASPGRESRHSGPAA